MSDEKPNIIIVHGCPSGPEKAGTYNKHWMPWSKEELIAEGFHVETPLMPNPWAPVYEAYKKEFEKYHVSENTILVGHSCGCAFLVRWLGETKQKIKKLILVAPWKIADKQDEFRPAFYNYSIDKGIKSRVDEIIMFTADDEEEDGKKSLKMYHDALGGKVIELKGRGHFVFDDMKTEKFPELIDAIVEDEDEEEDEEEDDEQEEKKSNKSQKLKEATKHMAMLAATAVMSAVVGAAAGFTICQNSAPVVAPTPTPAPAATTKPAPTPTLPTSSGVGTPTGSVGAVPPRTTPPAGGAATTPPPAPAPVEPSSIPPTEPPTPPADGTTP